MESSLKFAEQENPDFIILKEAILAFEKILITQQTKKGTSLDNEITDDQKTYIFKMLSSVNERFGTTDLEWFCAAESILNILFAIKSRNSHEYAKLFIE